VESHGGGGEREEMKAQSHRSLEGVAYAKFHTCMWRTKRKCAFPWDVIAPEVWSPSLARSHLPSPHRWVLRGTTGKQATRTTHNAYTTINSNSSLIVRPSCICAQLRSDKGRCVAPVEPVVMSVGQSVAHCMRNSKERARENREAN
jgi:hypothetical protein